MVHVHKRQLITPAKFKMLCHQGPKNHYFSSTTMCENWQHKSRITFHDSVDALCDGWYFVEHAYLSTPQTACIPALVERQLHVLFAT